MPRYEGRNHFIVRHDLASLQALPGFVWNSEKSKKERPLGFRTIQEDDRWISFAYTTGGDRQKAVSLVTGFYECIKTFRYGKLPPKALAIARGKNGAWLITGEPTGATLKEPVVIPPINNFIGKKLYHSTTITRISKDEFEKIQNYTRLHRFTPEKIPCLEREPLNEQEVLAIIANAPEKLGIKKIVRVQTRFPDMLVKLNGKAEEVHLELELYSSSFLNHGHEKQVRNQKLKGSQKSKGDNKSVGVLCWIDDDRNGVVRRHVHKIYELRELLKHKKTIRW